MKSSFSDDRGEIINYYEIFNLPGNADREEIRSAFCNLVKIYHPDITKKFSEIDKKKIDLIIKGYKILSDDDLRKDYDKCLLDVYRQRFSEEGFAYLPKKRVKYSFALKDLIMSRLLKKGMRRKDRLYNLGQDVEIFLNSDEAGSGAVAFVELPSRMQCPMCYGGDPACYLCLGVGRVSNTSNLEVKISPGIASGTIMDFDLMNFRPDRFTTFALRQLRIKITVSDKII